jgi:hypothetical protein
MRVTHAPGKEELEKEVARPKGAFELDGATWT